MKQLHLFLLMLLALIFFGCSEKVRVEDLKGFVATETYPDDFYLDTVSNKKAFIIIAHDDDDCAMSGTIAKLTADGWTIKQLSLLKTLKPNIPLNKTKYSPMTIFTKVPIEF